MHGSTRALNLLKAIPLYTLPDCKWQQSCWTGGARAAVTRQRKERREGGHSGRPYLNASGLTKDGDKDWQSLSEFSSLLQKKEKRKNPLAPGLGGQNAADIGPLTLSAPFIPLPCRTIATL